MNNQNVVRIEISFIIISIERCIGNIYILYVYYIYTIYIVYIYYIYMNAYKNLKT